MQGVIAAFAASALFYAGFATFKVAAGRMPWLRGTGPYSMAVVLLGQPLWLVGLMALIVGGALESAAFSALHVGTAAPLIVTGLVITLAVAMILYGERLTMREWLGLALVGSAMVMVARSVGRQHIPADLPAYAGILAITTVAMTLPYLLMTMEDRRPDGRHARRLSGVAYGVAAAFPLGTAELAIKCMADQNSGGIAASVLTPYPYIMVVTAGLAYGIIMLGFQKCRASVVITLATIIAKVHLLLTGTLLAGEPLPRDLASAALRGGGLVLAIAALALFPHYEEEAADTMEGPAGPFVPLPPAAASVPVPVTPPEAPAMPPPRPRPYVTPAPGRVNGSWRSTPRESGGYPASGPIAPPGFGPVRTPEDGHGGVRPPAPPQPPMR